MKSKPNILFFIVVFTAASGWHALSGSPCSFHRSHCLPAVIEVLPEPLYSVCDLLIFDLYVSISAAFLANDATCEAFAGHTLSTCGDTLLITRVISIEKAFLADVLSGELDIFMQSGIFVTKDIKLKINKFLAGFHSRHFYSAAIAVTAFRALGVYPRTNRYAEDSNPGR